MESFKIYLDRLRSGTSFRLKETFSSKFLEIEEGDLSFQKPVEVELEAYLTDDHLVICMSATAIASMPCAICNQLIEKTVEIKKYYHTAPLDQLPTVYLWDTLLREQILLETPQYAECEGGCLERNHIKSFLKKEVKDKQNETYYPFSDLS